LRPAESADNYLRGVPLRSLALWRYRALEQEPKIAKIKDQHWQGNAHRLVAPAHEIARSHAGRCDARKVSAI
jgi:hypothetical protein